MRRVLTAGIVLVVLLLLGYLLVRREKGPAQPAPVSVSRILGGIPAPGFLRAYQPRRFQFPQDHGPHPGFRNEWWYFTGNLRSAEGRSFGYQLTFFRAALAPRPVPRASNWGSSEVFMAHFAVTDIDGKRFYYAERFSRDALGLAGAAGSPLSVRLEDWSAMETGARPWSVKLTALDASMALDLDLQSLQSEILNGEGGLSRKSAAPGNASYYYSIPRLRTTGTVRSGKSSYRVSGLSWLDREWSTSALEPDQVGWDWFALQLEDGRDIMFYRIRRRDGSTDPFSGGTLVATNGAAKPLKRDEVQLEISRWWKSPATGSSYPALWRLRIPGAGINLYVTPKFPDQELQTSFRYWEGAVAVNSPSGAPVGSGYLEMTGY